MHEQNIICSKTRLDGTTHEQNIIRRQLFAGHVVDSRPMERKKKIHRMIITNIHEPEANNCFIIITQVIIEIPERGNIKFYHNLAYLPLLIRVHAVCVKVSNNAFFSTRSEKEAFSLTLILW